VKNPLDSTFDHRDPYRILGVDAGAAPDDIRKAYLGLAKRNHPNLFATDPAKYRTSIALMQNINAAYELLSDPHRREIWDRQHSITARPARAARREREMSQYYDPGLIQRVMRKYNDFVSSLHTASERSKAIRKIEKFQASPAGAAYIRGLAVLHYREVMDFLKSDKRITLYDDGLVEVMLLDGGAYEVLPSSVFVTYAYLCRRENRGRFPAGLGAKRTPAKEQGGVIRLRLAGSSSLSTWKPARGLAARVWEWLMEKPGERRGKPGDD
jgi:curved DNA-binding protein CbpA